MGINYSPKIVTDGLVLCLDAANPLSYPGSGNTWTDLSGNGNNGTLINGPTYSNNNKGNIVFDGTNDYISIPHNPTIKPTAAISMEQLLNADDWSAGVAGNYKTSLSCTQAGGYAHYIWGGNFISYVRANSTYQIPLTSVSGLSEWHHFVTTFDGRYTKLYLDGVLANIVDIGTTGNLIQYAYNNSLLVAAEVDSSTSPQGFYWDGKVAVTRIYNIALSLSQIQQNYNSLKGRYEL